MNFFVRNIFIIIFGVIIIYNPNSHANSKLFNKNEVKTDGISDFPKWTGALERTANEDRTYEKKCSDGSKAFYCNIAAWKEFLEGIASKPRAEQMKQVNIYANKHPYIIDSVNWGVDDYWESPGEFLSRNGDCEDYAIIKYMSLKFLGVPQEDMRIVILFDNNINAYHAVLAVYSKDSIVILDNQVNAILSDKKIYHYNPIFSVNEESWWRYM